MTWHKYVIAAMDELYPGASPLTDFLWVKESLTAVPEMTFWNEDKLGPLDFPALQAKAEELAARGYVPEQVTRAQALQALHAVGLLPQVRTAIAAYNDEAISIWFDHAGTWLRNNPYVLGIGLELGLTESQVDELFRSAATYG